MPVDIAGDGPDPAFQRLRGLVAGSGAKVEKRHPWMQVEMRHYGLRRMSWMRPVLAV